MKQKMLFLILCCSLASSIFAVTKKNASQALDQIIAVVNDDIITRSELNHALTLSQLEANHKNTISSAQQKKIMEELINHKLALQVAKQVGVKISNEELDRVIQHIAEQNGVSVSDLYERIHQEGLSQEDYRHEMRDQLTIQKLQQQEVGSKIILSKAELNSVKNSHVMTYHYHIEDILLPLDESAQENEIVKAREEANHLLTTLNRGINLKTALHEKNITNIEVNDLGFRTIDEMPSKFVPFVSHLAVNKISGPIQTANGFHLLRLIAKKSTENSEEIQKAENALFQNKVQKETEKWMVKLRKDAFVETHLS